MDNAYTVYEREKKKIQARRPPGQSRFESLPAVQGDDSATTRALNLTQKEYETAIRELIARLGI